MAVWSIASWTRKALFHVRVPLYFTHVLFYLGLFVCAYVRGSCLWTTVSVNEILLCLLVPSMLGYKVWWLNRDKELWEGQGEHEKEKKNVWSLPQLFLSETVAREVTSSEGNSFFLTVTLTLRSLRTREKAEKRGEELPFLSVPVLSPFSHPFSR